MREDGFADVAPDVAEVELAAADGRPAGAFGKAVGGVVEEGIQDGGDGVIEAQRLQDLLERSLFAPQAMLLKW